ncbi:MAG: hypothetical protein GY938_17010, partial [Ketobacter sp.]|nr:hypothetical protein [Ketobacter sp.]
MDPHTSAPAEAIVTHTEFDSVPAKLDVVIDEVNALGNNLDALDLSGIATNAAAITAINTLLASDDTTLDELQEIVDFIKTNKTTLDALGISSISGLQTALDDKTTTAGVQAAYPLPSQAAAEAGEDATPRLWSAQRQAQAIEAANKAGYVFADTTERDAFTAWEGLICITIDTDNYYKYISSAWAAYSGAKP